MANDFSGDGNCVALYKFESGAFVTDSAGSNDLTNSNTVQEDSIYYKEGSQSAYFSDANDEKFFITDANLDSGFPLKSGETNRSFSICFWVRPTDDTFNHGVIGKHEFNEGGFYLYIPNTLTPTLRIYGSASWGQYSHASALTLEQWYHIGITYDYSDDSYRIRIWDDTAGSILGSDKTGTAATTEVTNNTFYVGMAEGTRELDGNLDEVVVFNDVLSTDEIDQIRAGTYGAAGPAMPAINQPIAVTESISVALQALAGLSISVLENLAVSEYRAMSMPLGSISIFDGIGTGETIGENMPLAAITGVENITVIEFLQLLKDLVPSVFDNIGVQEFIQILSSNPTISVSDSIGVSEFISAVTNDLLASGSDIVAVTEFLTAVMEIVTSASEDIGIAESVTIIIDLLKSVFETIAVTEDLSVAMEGVIGSPSISQSIAIIENISAALEQILGTVSISQSVAVSESISVAAELAGISAADTIAVVESIVASLPLSLTISDLIAVSEYILVNLEAGATVIESINLSENIQIHFDNLLASRIENLTITEFLNVTISSIVGKVSAAFTLSRPGAGFTFSRPNAGFTLH